MTIFNILAIIIGLGAVVSLFLGLFTWDMPLFASGFLNLLHAYAWSMVSDIRQELNELKRRNQ